MDNGQQELWRLTPIDTQQAEEDQQWRAEQQRQLEEDLQQRWADEGQGQLQAQHAWELNQQDLLQAQHREEEALQLEMQERQPRPQLFPRPEQH